MIDLSKVFEIRNILDNKVIEKIEDEQGRIIYESGKELTTSGVPPLIIYSSGVNLINYKMYGNSVQNGTPTPTTPIEIESVGEYDETTGKYKIPIKVSNDLFKGVKLEQGTIADATGNLSDSTTRVRTHLFVLEPGIYKFQLDWSINKTLLRGIHIYNYESEQHEKYTAYNSQNATFTLSEKVKVRLIFNKSNNTTITLEDVLVSNPILQLGETIGEVIEKITNIYLNEPLRKIGDNVDYIDFKNSMVVRVIEKRLCSELEWNKHASYKYIYYFTSARVQPNINPMSEMFDRTKYQPADSIRNMTTDYCIKGNATSSTVYISDSVHTTIGEFNEFIKDKYVYYVLKKQAEETIELPNIPTLKGHCALVVDTEIQPSNLEVVYKGKQ